MKRFKSVLFFSNPGVNQDAAIERTGSLAQRHGTGLPILRVIKEAPDESRFPDAGSALNHPHRCPYVAAFFIVQASEV